MKTTKKILSILIAAVIVFTMIPLTAFADNQTAEDFISNENLAVLAEDLLKSLAARGDQDIGTVLKLVFQFVKEDSLQQEIGNKDVTALSDKELADILVSWLNKQLPELTKDIPDAVNSLLKLFSSNASLKSVDGIMETLAAACDSSLVKSAGDLKNLSAAKLKSGKKVITTKNGFTNLDIVKALLNWIADDGQIKIVKKLIMGNLTLGKIATFDLDELVNINDINAQMKALPDTLKEAIYNLAPLRDAEGNKIAYADSDYRKEGYTADELLACALINLLKDGKVDKAEAKAAADMTFYELLGKYAEDAITKYAVEPINGQFKRWLQNDVITDSNFAFLKDMINWDFNVTAKTFNLDGVATDGIFSKINTIVVGFCKEVFTADAFNEMGLQDGGNDKLQGNLENAIRCILSKVPDNFQGYDFSEVKKNLDKLSLNELVVKILDLFCPQWFGTNAPAEVTTLGQMAGWAAYTAIEKFVMSEEKYATFADNFASYKDLVFDKDGKVYTGLSDDEWINKVLTMGVDVGVYALNRNSKDTHFVLTPEQVTANKAAGWGWKDFLDEVVDWAVNYAKGFPAIADELSAKRGQYDGFGPFYKINVILNDLLPLSFLNDCGGDTIFYADTETLVIEKLLKSILQFDISGIANVLDVNNNADNPFNKPLISAVLDLAENLVFSIFKYDTAVNDTVYTIEATCKSEGYEYKVGKNDKFMRIVNTLEKNDNHSWDDGVVTKAATCTEDGVTTFTCKECGTTLEKKIKATGHNFVDGVCSVCGAKEGNTPDPEPTPDFILGDVNGDGKIKLADARLALRIVARLENATEAQIKAADLNGDGKVTAKEVRRILRYVARLESSLVD